MPLARAIDRYTVGTDGICFLMQVPDTSQEVVCLVGIETLYQIGPDDGLDGAK